MPRHKSIPKCKNSNTEESHDEPTLSTTSVIETAAPVVAEAIASATDIPAPDAEAIAPVTEISAPVTETPAPVAEAITPVIETPAPVAEAIAPVAEIPAPVAEIPAPAITEPVAEVTPVPPPRASLFRRILNWFLL
jgi:hypothetical protein